MCNFFIVWNWDYIFLSIEKNYSSFFIKNFKKKLIVFLKSENFPATQIPCRLADTQLANLQNNLEWLDAEGLIYYLIFIFISPFFYFHETKNRKQINFEDFSQFQKQLLKKRLTLKVLCNRFSILQNVFYFR